MFLGWNRAVSFLQNYLFGAKAHECTPEKKENHSRTGQSALGKTITKNKSRIKERLLTIGVCNFYSTLTALYLNWTSTQKGLPFQFKPGALTRRRLASADPLQRFCQWLGQDGRWGRVHWSSRWTISSSAKRKIICILWKQSRYSTSHGDSRETPVPYVFVRECW